MTRLHYLPRTQTLQLLVPVQDDAERRAGAAGSPECESAVRRNVEPVDARNHDSQAAVELRLRGIESGSPDGRVSQKEKMVGGKESAGANATRAKPACQPRDAMAMDPKHRGSGLGRRREGPPAYTR